MLIIARRFNFMKIISHLLETFSQSRLEVMLVEMSARMRQKIDTLDWRMIWIHNLNWEHSLSQYSFQVWFPATLVTRSLEEKFDTYKSLRELRRIDFRLMKGILCLSVRLCNFLSRKSSQAKRFVISMYELSFVEKQWHVLHRNGRCLKKDYEQTSCSLWLKVNCRQKARCMKHLKEKKMKMKINSQCQYTSRDSWNSVM